MKRRAGFTLVEIMVVVTIIGLLAAIAIPGFEKARQTAVSRRYINDARQFRDAVERYAMEKGVFPPNGVGMIPAVLTGYVPNSIMTATRTPIGGTWDWDNGINGFDAAVSVRNATADDAVLISIDRVIDDGDLSTGFFQKINNKVSLVVQM